MKLWFDIRSLDQKTHYGAMMIKVIKKLIEVDNKNEYIVYTKSSIWLEKQEKITSAKPWDAFADISLSKEMKNQAFWMMVFFDHRVPLFYKEDFIVMIPSLKESFFMGKDFLQREIYNYYMKKTIARAKKIICFEKYTAWELNERLNVNEDKIQIMKPYFDISWIPNVIEALKIDIKSKHNLSNDYLIYDGGNGPNKNIEKLIKTFGKLQKSWEHIHLFILWEETSRDTDIRDMIIASKLQDRVDFIANIPLNEEVFYYRQSKGVIFPSIYESFPFSLKKSIAYGSPILASDIWPIKEFMWAKINYFNPKSTHDMEDAILKFLKKKKTPDYSNLFTELTLPKTIKEFYSIIIKA